MGKSPDREPVTHDQAEAMRQYWRVCDLCARALRTPDEAVAMREPTYRLQMIVCRACEPRAVRARWKYLS